MQDELALSIINCIQLLVLGYMVYCLARLRTLTKGALLRWEEHKKELQETYGHVIKLVAEQETESDQPPQHH